jgi:hypothetical protein
LSSGGLNRLVQERVRKGVDNVAKEKTETRDVVETIFLITPELVEALPAQPPIRR